MTGPWDLLGWLLLGWLAWGVLDMLAGSGSGSAGSGAPAPWWDRWWVPSALFLASFPLGLAALFILHWILNP